MNLKEYTLLCFFFYMCLLNFLVFVFCLGYSHQSLWKLVSYIWIIIIVEQWHVFKTFIFFKHKSIWSSQKKCIDGFLAIGLEDNIILTFLVEMQKHAIGVS